jgi:pimeloyl-ACP methyl ester carboxylesterase
VQGSGPDVILIPGLTASRDMWRATVAAVPGYRYHLVQVNGFGGTRPGANASGPVVQPVASEIERYIAAGGLRSPALIGHSMGGTLAMMIAAHNPRSVGRVMVVDMLPQPAGLVGGSASGIGPLADSLRDALTSTPAGRRLLGNLIGNYGADDPGHRSDPDVVASATHDLARTDLSPQLPRIAAPMTVLFATPGAGTSAHLRLVQDYRLAYSGARTAKLRPIPRSGHMIMVDQPARFYEEVKRFLAD